MSTYIIVKYSNENLEILNYNDDKFIKNGKLPEPFWRQLDIFSKLNCESISFKFHDLEDFYSIIITKTHDEYKFEIKKIEDIRKENKNTDQMLQLISEKYLEENDGILFEGSEGSHKVLLSIYLELRKLKSDLNLKNESLIDRINVNEKLLLDRLETIKEHLETQFSKDFLFKKDFNIWSLISNSKKLDWVGLFLILSLFSGLANYIEVRKVVDDLLEKPSELVQ